MIGVGFDLLLRLTLMNSEAKNLLANATMNSFQIVLFCEECKKISFCRESSVERKEFLFQIQQTEKFKNLFV